MYSLCDCPWLDYHVGGLVGVRVFKRQSPWLDYHVGGLVGVRVFKRQTPG